MENYPSNSHKAREEVAEKKVEKVVSGKTSTKKKSGIRKLSDTFLSEDVSNVKSYIFSEVLLPAAKKLVSDIVTNGTNMLLYGEIKNKKGNSSKVSYSRYYDDRSRDYRSPVVRNNFDYDEIIFETRGDAEAVLDAMYDILNQYKVVSVAELYDLAFFKQKTAYGICLSDWSSDVCSSDLIAKAHGYILKLPRALAID